MEIELSDYFWGPQTVVSQSWTTGESTVDDSQIRRPAITGHHYEEWVSNESCSSLIPATDCFDNGGEISTVHFETDITPMVFLVSHTAGRGGIPAVRSIWPSECGQPRINAYEFEVEDPNRNWCVQLTAIDPGGAARHGDVYCPASDGPQESPLPEASGGAADAGASDAGAADAGAADAGAADAGAADDEAIDSGTLDGGTVDGGFDDDSTSGCSVAPVPTSSSPLVGLLLAFAVIQRRKD